MKRQAFRRYVPLVVAYEMAKDWHLGRRVESGRGAQSVGSSVEEAAAYASASADVLMKRGGLRSLDGLHVLELGPGDNLGVALRFLAAGAERVVCLDRFAIRRDPDFEQRVYERLRAGLDEDLRERADPKQVELVQGVGIEDSERLFGAESFDLIASVAVLEHVGDPDSALRAMDRLLKPGGVMLHQIDLRDHGYLTDGGHHPLAFLTLSDRVWRLMTARSGGPNRRMVDYWRSALPGYRVELTVTTIAGRDGAVWGAEFTDEDRRLAEQIRPKLAPRFRELAADDLLTAGVFMVARKPSR